MDLAKDPNTGGPLARSTTSKLKLDKALAGRSQMAVTLVFKSKRSGANRLVATSKIECLHWRAGAVPLEMIATVPAPPAGR